MELYLVYPTCVADPVSPVVEDVVRSVVQGRSVSGESQHVLHARNPMYNRVILPLEVLKTMNGLISLKLSINVTISFRGRDRRRR